MYLFHGTEGLADPMQIQSDSFHDLMTWLELFLQKGSTLLTSRQKTFRGPALLSFVVFGTFNLSFDVPLWVHIMILNLLHPPTD